MNKLSISMRMR